MDAKTKSEKVEAAIKAHFAWFERIRSAIKVGKSEFKPSIVAMDNQCEFGKWIYSDLRSLCDQSQYDRIKALHAKFHNKASEILKMALAGQQEKALSEVTPTSDLGKVSGELLLILRGL